MAESPARPPVDPLIAALRARRRALGLRVEDIAQRTGYSRSGIYAWENGDRTPAPAALRAYAKAVEARIELVALTPAPLQITDVVVGLAPDSRELRTRSAAEIARRYDCSPRTVQRHRAREVS